MSSAAKGLMFVVVLLVSAGVVLPTELGCSSESSTSCTCNIDVNGDKKTLGCNESACVGGYNFTCGSDGQSTKGNTCSGSSSSSSGSSTSSSSSGSSTSSSSSGSTSSSSGASGGSSCDQLATYCDTKCSNAAAANKSCKDTVAAGNESKCAVWVSVNGSLCK